jgi:hypothetical protein
MHDESHGVAEGFKAACCVLLRFESGAARNACATGPPRPQSLRATGTAVATDLQLSRGPMVAVCASGLDRVKRSPMALSESDRARGP